MCVISKEEYYARKTRLYFFSLEGHIIFLYQNQLGKKYRLEKKDDDGHVAMMFLCPTKTCTKESITEMKKEEVDELARQVPNYVLGHGPAEKQGGSIRVETDNYTVYVVYNFEQLEQELEDIYKNDNTDF